MSDKIEYSRLIQKRFSQSGVVPTIPASGSTTLSQLVYTDLLIGEIAFNLPDKRMWFRAETEIVEIFGVSGGTYANLFIEGDSDTSINSIANNNSGGINSGEYNFTVGEDNSTFADNSAVIAGFDNIINIDSDNSAIIGGNGNIISGATNVIMLGCENIDAFQSGSTYVQNLVITDVPSTGNTNTDLVLLRGLNGAVTAVPVSDLPGGGSSYTFENGLSESGDTVTLGGTLIKDTTIDTSTFYNMATKDDSKGGYLDDAFLVSEVGLFPLSALGIDNIYGAVDGDAVTTSLSQDINFTIPPGPFGPNNTIFNSNNIVLLNDDDGIITNTIKTTGFTSSMNVTKESVIMSVFDLNVNPETNGILIDRDKLVIRNELESDLTQKGIHYSDDGLNFDDYSVFWDATTDDGILSTKGYVDRATSGGPVTSYNQFPTGSDNDAFYDDGFLEFS